MRKVGMLLMMMLCVGFALAVQSEVSSDFVVKSMDAPINSYVSKGISYDGYWYSAFVVAVILAVLYFILRKVFGKKVSKARKVKKVVKKVGRIRKKVAKKGKK